MSATDCRPDTPATSLVRALSLLGHGLPCFPCGITKKPTTPRGFKDATCDPDALCELWKKHPGPLVGIPTGEISGLDVLDIDGRHGGDGWLAEHKHRLPTTRILVLAVPAFTCFSSISRGCDVAPGGLQPESMYAPLAVTSSGGPPPGFRYSQTCRRWRGPVGSVRS
jgi:Bifunctional DNA primase/polymerase, N-terminal